MLVILCKKNASHTIISFCALSEKNAMKLRMPFLFCLAVLICGVSVAHAQNDWLTVYMVDGQTIQIDGNQYPYGTVRNNGDADGTCPNNFNGYAVISVDSGMAIHLYGQYSFRNLNGWITIWDGDTNGIPLSWRLTGIGTLNVTSTSGRITIRAQTGTGNLEHCGFFFHYAVADPDSCASVIDLAVDDACCDCEPMEYQLYWRYNWQPHHWEVEYGPHGFELGSGTVVEVDANQCVFNLTELEFNRLLQPNTIYDFYVRSVCEDGLYGEWDSVSYHTYCARVDSITALEEDVTVTPDGLLAGYKATWRDTTDTRRWFVYYHRTGSNPFWDSPCKSAYVDTPLYCFPPLAPNIQYSFVVQSLCDGSGGIKQWIYFTTADVGINETDATDLSVSPNPAVGHCVVSLPDSMSAELKLYGSDGRLLQTAAYHGVPVELQLPSQGVFLLQATTEAGTVTRKIINK